MVAITQRDISDTRLYVVASVEQYRQLARELPQGEDCVVEIGASTGRTTTILAENASTVVAIEKGEPPVAEARRAAQTLRNVRIRRKDAFDISGLFSEAPLADMVFIDVGGDAPVENSVALLRIYRAVYAPREMVLRNITLCKIVNAITMCEPLSRDRIGDIRSLPQIAEGTQSFLMGLSTDREASIRRAAARALAREATLVSISCLVRLLDDPVNRVSQAGLKSLMKMGPQIAPDLQTALRQRCWGQGEEGDS